MNFEKIFETRRPTLSFELFPPKTEKGMQALRERLPKLVELEPTFITVTYGAMGTTQNRTLEIVCEIKDRFGMEVAHHLTCVGADQAELRQIIETIRSRGIENIVALRGDPPRGEDAFKAVPGGFENASQLVQLIRQTSSCGVAVAGYPETHLEAPDAATDLRYLKEKVDRGADVIITQLFFDNSRFFEFVQRCRKAGIETPIVPGLMPILNVNQIKRITRMCGCTIPGTLLEQLNAAHDDEQVVEIGIRHIVEQSIDLLNKGVDGIHFYVLNRYFQIAEIMKAIRDELRQLRSAD